MSCLTQEWILKTLMELGFKQEEAEVYFLLYRDGPKKAREIIDELKIYKRKVYRILRKLEKTKIIQAEPVSPACFRVVPLDNFLDLLIRNCLDEANFLEGKKPKFISNWKSIIDKIDIASDDQK
jgi:sugar-specific transcriptional regulator TrmB